MELELLNSNDINIMRSFYTDENIMKMITGYVVDEEGVLERFQRILSWDNQKGYGYYKAYVDNQLIGVGCLKPSQQNVEVGYMLYPEYWNKGLGKQLCKLLIEKVKKMDVYKAVAYIDPNNIASKRVLVNCGFKSIYQKKESEYFELNIKNNITGYTGLYGIVANPIKHSFSPLMHNTAFQALGIDDIYLAFEVEENKLEDFIRSVKVLNIKGFNVSMPYKLKIMEYLDDLTDEAKLCQAVNTVKNEDGKLTGHISDGKGFFLACKEKNWDIKNQKVIVLGAGGAATAIIVEAALLGAKEIIIYNRSDKPYIRELNEKLNCPITLKSLSDLNQLKEDLLDAYLLIQTTNVGMDPQIDECLIPDSSYLPKHLKVADIIYKPAQTKLLRLANEKGLEYMNGKGMILYQGAVSFEYWTKRKMPIQEVKQALRME